MHIPRRKTTLLLLASASLVAAPTAVLASGGGKHSGGADDRGGKHSGGKHDRGHHSGPQSTTPPPATIALPNGWQPEGIAAGKKALFIGSIPTGGVYKADPKTGQGSVFVQGRTGRAAIGMKVAGRYLVVAGGTTGHAFVYDAKTGADVADVTLTTGNSFINDVAIAGRFAYFTDSRQQQLYRLDLGTRGGSGDDSGHHRSAGKHLGRGGSGSDDSGKSGSDDSGKSGSDDSGRHGGKHGADDASKSTGVATTATTIPITGALVTADDNDPATNDANGIVALKGGKAVVVVNSRVGQLYKVDTATGASTQLALTGGDVLNGDGLLLEGRTLYAVQNRLNKIAVVNLSKDATAGTIERTITNPAFRVPTTLAKAGKGLFAVNARFGTPATPDTDYDVVRVSTK